MRIKMTTAALVGASMMLTGCFNSADDQAKQKSSVEKCISNGLGEAFTVNVTDYKSKPNIQQKFVLKFDVSAKANDAHVLTYDNSVLGNDTPAHLDRVYAAQLLPPMPGEKKKDKKGDPKPVLPTGVALDLPEQAATAAHNCG